MEKDQNEKNQTLADMIVDSLIEAGLLDEKEIERATEIVLEEIIVRETLESVRES